MQKILLFEYLHADAELFAHSPDSMRGEGRAMLVALATDLSQISGGVVDTAICKSAAKALSSCLRNLSGQVKEISASGMSDVASQLSTLAGHYDFVIPIAPECDGILSQVVQRLRQDGHDVVAPNCHAIELCSDKWETWKQLRRESVPTVPTHLATEDSLGALGLDQATNLFVVKPRDGAGCDGVRKTLLPAIQRDIAAGTLSSEAIIQPFIDGQSFSFGMLGSGDDGSPIMLPLTVQKIQWHLDRPQYVGGTVLSASDHKFKKQIVELGHQVGRLIGPFTGYVGVDLLLPHGTEQFLVTEINPRLCTSYLGYRRATTINLSKAILDSMNPDEFRWSVDRVDFSANS